jgi:hypothetical protein
VLVGFLPGVVVQILEWLSRPQIFGLLYVYGLNLLHLGMLVVAMDTMPIRLLRADLMPTILFIVRWWVTDIIFQDITLYRKLFLYAFVRFGLML